MYKDCHLRFEDYIVGYNQKLSALIQGISQDLRDIFDPVVNQIIDLIKTQMEDANKEMEHGTINVYTGIPMT